MKAYIIKNPGQGVTAWEQTTLPDPKPNSGEVVIAVKAVSLNFRDVLIAKGLYPIPPLQNAIAVSDGAGEVVEVGSGVTKWKVGDRVCGSFFQSWKTGPIPEDAQAYALGGSLHGMLAQRVALSQDGVVRVPEHLSYEEAATLPCAALTAWNALVESANPLQPGATVLTLGTGGVSIFAAQIALALGCKVIATTSGDSKIERLKALGVSAVVNYKTHPEWDKEVLAVNGGKHVDHVIEVGGSGTLERSLNAVRTGGTVSLIGVLSGLGSAINPDPVLFKNIRLQGILIGSVQMFENMNHLISSHTLRPVIHKAFPFDQAHDAYESLESSGHFGKVVIGVE
ncbi:MAG: NAD(P)-dependent alcohol dehydrogenase [Chthoniobacteraceae bacterium]